MIAALPRSCFHSLESQSGAPRDLTGRLSVGTQRISL
jgi:hypothetical protein